MGQAKLRGTFEERKAQAIAAGRSFKALKARKESIKFKKHKQRQLAQQLAISLIYGQYR